MRELRSCLNEIESKDAAAARCGEVHADEEEEMKVVCVVGLVSFAMTVRHARPITESVFVR